MASFSTLYPGARPLAILDGGMGTTLQAPPFSLPLSSSLWSSELLASASGQAELLKLHQLWLDSGSDILGSCTCTYASPSHPLTANADFDFLSTKEDQSSLPLFLPSTPPNGNSYTQAEMATARHTMLSALSLITSPSLRGAHHSALALGPYGAQLTPGAEYSGLYPPPYGSSTLSKPSYPSLALPNLSLPPTDDAAQDALTAFHLSRLEDFFLENAPEFNKMNLWAFETVPLVREAIAIRRAVALFLSRNPTVSKRDFYISFVFPFSLSPSPSESGTGTGTGAETRFPDPEYAHLSAEEVVRVLVHAALGEREGEALPAGVGVNCTSPMHVGSVVQQLEDAVRVTAKGRKERPWLVLYPDGGSVYDVVTRTWSNPDGIDEGQWAHLVTDVAKASLQAKSRDEAQDGDWVWGGVMAGGCCKAGPRAISLLRKRCEEEGLVQRKV